MITLFGATGFTGQKVASALERAGLPYRLAGRSASKLDVLSRQLASHPAWIEVDAGNSNSLPRLFPGTRVLINCAGPFTDIGEQVLAQAAISGTSYLDTTNELGFVFRAQAHHKMARQSGAALVPAAGFEVAVADCLAELAARRLPAGKNAPIDQLDVVYQLDGVRSSAGTRLSAVRSLATSWIAFRNGDWVGQAPSGKVRRFTLPKGKRAAMQFPSCESITAPAHLPLQNVDCWMTTNASARLWAPLTIPALARLSRSVLRPLILKAVARNGAPAPDSGQNDLFTVYVRVRRGADTRWQAVSGQSPYQVTADGIVYFAQALLHLEGRSGLLAPAQVVDPGDFLAYGGKNWGWTLMEG